MDPAHRKPIESGVPMGGVEVSAARFKKYLFVCENRRDEGACCMPHGEGIREGLKAAVKERGLASLLRVSRSGCLDVCEEGPNVLLMPDNKWFKHVSADNLEPILREAQKGL